MGRIWLFTRAIGSFALGAAFIITGAVVYGQGSSSDVATATRPARSTPPARTAAPFTNTVRPSPSATAGPSLFGRVTADTGSPIPSVIVRAYRGTAIVSQQSSRPDGSFSFDLPAGTYRLQLTPPTSAHWSEYWPQKDTFIEATEIVVPRAAPLEARLSSAITIGGRVKISDGSIPRGATVYAFRSDACCSYLTTGRTLADGTYRLRVRGGTYRLLYVGDRGSTFAPRWYGDADTWQQASALTVTAERAGLDVTLPAGAFSLSGAILKKDTQQFYVYVHRGERSICCTDLVAIVLDDPSGAWALPVAPGSYAVRFVPVAGGIPMRWWGGGSDYATAGRVAVRADTAIDVDLR